MLISELEKNVLNWKLTKKQKNKNIKKLQKKKNKQNTKSRVSLSWFKKKKRERKCGRMSFPLRGWVTPLNWII